MSATRSPYEVLGISRDAQPEEIDEACRRRASLVRLSAANAEERRQLRALAQASCLGSGRGTTV